ncbi:MAG: ABC transporter ATP-binding protein [Planctomycetota bacterium]|nr:MAG: ABC transporter ATP-binding protein [Planctomycetota bacterium]
MIHADTHLESREEKPVVVVRQLRKVFKDFWMRPRVRAVDGIDLEIGPHEVFGLLGPNGSGKSTTIKILLGLLHKTSGLVAVFGRSPTDVEIKRRIGYLPEETYLYPFLTARETLEHYGRLFQLDAPVRRRRVDELLDMVGLTAAQHRQLHEFSKGMQRRVALAQALINDPELLILDEPTSGLDPIGARQVKDLILELGSRGKTVLLSSHLLADVEDCVDRAAILYGGRIRAQGAIDELLDEPDRVVIETDALDERALEEVTRVLRDKAGATIRRVARPRKNLEEFFLEIVEQAQRDRVETAGAVAGSGPAAFLRGEEEEQAPALEGEQLLQSLAAEQASEEQPPAHGQAAADSEEEGSTEDLLQRLVASTEPGEEEPAGGGLDAVDAAQRQKDEAAVQRDDVDRALLDALTSARKPDESAQEP